MGLLLLHAVIASGLPTRLRLLALVLALHDQDDQSGRRICASWATLCAETGLGRDALKAQLRELRHIGVVEVIDAAGGRRMPTVYGFNTSALPPRVAANADARSAGAQGLVETAVAADAGIYIPALPDTGVSANPLDGFLYAPRKQRENNKTGKQREQKTPCEQATAPVGASVFEESACPLCRRESCEDLLDCIRERVSVIGDLDEVFGPLVDASVELLQ